MITGISAILEGVGHRHRDRILAVIPGMVTQKSRYQGRTGSIGV